MNQRPGLKLKRYLFLSSKDLLDNAIFADSVLFFISFKTDELRNIPSTLLLISSNTPRDQWQMYLASMLSKWQ